jgi:hypothetical protein
VNPTNWRITFPIEKAEQREDGIYIVGLASGPEIDATGERMSEDLVSRFADQINSTGGLALSNRLPYRDAHAPDGVLRDLGWLTKSWVNDEQRLAVEVKLDEENPAALYLFRALKRGKQYGMSVAGKVIDFADEFVTEIGKTVRTYKDVILTEISNTTRPAWTPSFGSVLAKALADEATEPVALNPNDTASAESADGGPNVVSDESNANAQAEPVAESQEQPVETPEAPEVTTPEAEVPAPAAETVVVEEPVAEAAVTADADQPVETEKSSDGYAAISAAYTLESLMSILADDDSPEAANLKSAAESIMAFLAARLAAKSDETHLAAEEVVEGITTPEETAEKAASEEPGEIVETPAVETPSEPTPAADIDALVRSVTELTAKVAELEARPTTTLPPIVERAESDFSEFTKAMAELTREQRLRVAMAARTGGR